MRWLAVVLLLTGCGRKSAAPSGSATRKIIDGVGHELRVGNLQRVVSLAPSSTEILFALGAGSLVVGTDRFSDWPPEARKLEHVGADIDPSLERILGLKPDVVFTAASANTEATANALTRVGMTVYTSRVESLEAFFHDVEGIGEAVNRPAQAAQLVASMRERIAAIAVRVAGPTVRAAVVVWSEPLLVAGGKSHVAGLLRAAGGVNIADDSPQLFPSYSMERLVERAPEVLIVGTHGNVTPPIAALQALTSIPAVRNHRIHMIDGDLLFRPGPRLPDGVEALARALHPERFTP